jgi:hypothetical protein
MKDNLWDKKIIEFDNVHNFRCGFAWLTQIHFVFLIKYCFLSILFFNIELTRD